MSDDHKHTSLFGYMMVFVALMVGTVVTWLAYKLDIDNPALNIAVALGIALAKASLVLYFFMHLRESARIVKATAITGFVFLVILLIFALQDVISRGPLDSLDPWPVTTLR